MLALDRPEIADAAANISPDAFRNIIVYLQSAVRYGFLRSSYGVLNESAHLARFLLLDVIQRIEVFDFTGKPNGKLFGVKFFDVIRAAAAFLKRGPGSLDRIPNRRDQTKSSNNYAALQNEILH